MIHEDADHCTRHHTYVNGCRYNINNASRPNRPDILRPGFWIQGVRLDATDVRQVA